jgi:hypothetical protein
VSQSGRISRTFQVCNRSLSPLRSSRFRFHKRLGQHEPLRQPIAMLSLFESLPNRPR